MRAIVTYAGRQVAMLPHESLLDAMIRTGLEPAFSCRKGSCHACMLQVVEGTVPAAAQRGLSAPQVGAGCFLPCQCTPTSDLQVQKVDPATQWHGATLVEAEMLAADIRRLRLEPHVGLTWRPGQQVSLQHPDGSTRPYSIVSLQDEDWFLTLDVRRVPGGRVSGWLVDQLAVGEDVRFQGPGGAFAYRTHDACRALVVLATGTGAGAAMGIVRDALVQQHRGPIEVWCGGRTRQDLYLLNAFRALAVENSSLVVRACVSQQDASDGVVNGRVAACAFPHGMDRTGTVLYLCGNPNMVAEARWRAVAAGVARADILADPFESAYPQPPQDVAHMAEVLPDAALWAALGEGTVLRLILQDFYARVYQDERLAPFFHNVTVDRAIEKQHAFLRDMILGSREYFGLRPFNAHHWMVISDELFDYREALFDACVVRAGVAEVHHRRWRALHERFRSDIVKSVPRGLVINGVERYLEGMQRERLDVGSLCDGCAVELPAGTVARFHQRTGRLFCEDCGATAQAG